MKQTIKKLSFAVAFLTAVESYGQQGDLTHPAFKDKSQAVSNSLTRGEINPVIIYDGVTLFNQASLGKLDPNILDSVKIVRDSIFDVHNNLKFTSIIKITTAEGSNPTLKHVKEETRYWIEKHPLAVFSLNGKVLLTDQDKLNQLAALKISEIREIKTLNSDQGRQRLGTLGENGVIVIIVD